MGRAFNVVPSQAADKFVVRFPAEMRDQIAVVAQVNHRSMNSEIVNRLDESLGRDGIVDESATKLDDAELSLYECELLMQFRQLSHRQQNALMSLIERDGPRII